MTEQKKLVTEPLSPNLVFEKSTLSYTSFQLLNQLKSKYILSTPPPPKTLLNATYKPHANSKLVQA